MSGRDATRRRGARRPLPWLAALAVISLSVGSAASAAGAPADTLGMFRRWLDREHPGYGCDEGPAPFRNAKVAAAYPGQRFYYVLTYTRGIRPPFQNALSLVARLGETGEFRRVGFPSVASYQSGLRAVRSARDARRAAAAILILAMGDPGERRWRVSEDLIGAKKRKGGWVCRYRHGDDLHVSEVVFDKRGRVQEIRVNAPPVP